MEKLEDRNSSWVFSTNLSVEQAIDVWEELKDAYNDEANFGGKTSEIYAYRLMPYSPSFAQNPNSDFHSDEHKELCKLAGFNLLQLCRQFTRKHDEFNGCGGIKIEIEDEKGWQNVWDMKEFLLGHRCHVRVTHNG